MNFDSLFRLLEVLGQFQNSYSEPALLAAWHNFCFAFHVVLPRFNIFSCWPFRDSGRTNPFGSPLRTEGVDEQLRACQRKWQKFEVGQKKLKCAKLGTCRSSADRKRHGSCGLELQESEQAAYKLKNPNKSFISLVEPAFSPSARVAWYQYRYAG